MFRYNGKWTLNYLSRDKVMCFAAVKAFYSLEFVLLLKIHFCFSLNRKLPLSGRIFSVLKQKYSITPFLSRRENKTHIRCRPIVVLIISDSTVTY